MASLSVRVFGAACSVLSLCALPARAQEKSRDEKPAPAGIPQSAMPPAGMCRVWLRDVPAGQQPAPTDCISAIRKSPPSAIVLFGNPKSETASPSQSRPAAPGMNPRTNARMGDGSGRAPVSANRGFAPGGQRGAPIRTDRSGAARNPAGGPPPSAARAPAPPPTKPPEKPQS